VVATCLAKCIFSNPQKVYSWRVIFLLVLVPVVVYYCNPNFAFSGPLNAMLLNSCKLEGRQWGTFTVPLWLLIALFKQPKGAPAQSKRDEQTGRTVSSR